jgi:hypothetical protein
MLFCCVVCCVVLIIGAGGRSGVGRVAERLAAGDGDVISLSCVITALERLRDGVGVVGCCL